MTLLALACTGGSGGRGDGACALELSLDEAVLDACDAACGALRGGPGGGEVTLSWGAGGQSTRLKLDEDGAATFCLSGPHEVGERTLVASAPDAGCEEVTAELEVHPFGWAWGFDKPIEALESLPWVPEIEGLDDPPILEPERGSWDGLVLSMPSWIEWEGRELLAYGARDDESDYELGLAARAPGGVFERVVDEPLLSDHATKRDIGPRNTPEWLTIDGELWLAYNGEAEGEYVAIDLAWTEDGETFTAYEDNPVLTASDLPGDPTINSESVAHASILQRDGVYEMWFATGKLWIGYALSSDGFDWEPYCRNPVFEGLGTWDEGKVKAPEVVYEDDTYWMSFSGCDRGCYQVGWAASTDGIRWVAEEEPILPAQGGNAWNGEATQGAEVRVDGDTWSFWYAGSDGVATSLGLATAVKG